MNAKTFFISWLPVFILVFLLNGLFHSLLAASFFDEHLSYFGSNIHKMADANPLPVAILDACITLVMFYFISKQGAITPAQGAITGGLINLVSSGAWNLANTATFNWPVIVTVGDMAWHVCLGAIGGIVMTILYKRSIGTQVKVTA